MCIGEVVKPSACQARNAQIARSLIFAIEDAAPSTSLSGYGMTDCGMANRDRLWGDIRHIKGGVDVSVVVSGQFWSSMASFDWSDQGVLFAELELFGGSGVGERAKCGRSCAGSAAGGSGESAARGGRNSGEL